MSEFEWEKVGTRKPGTFVAITVDDIPWLADRYTTPPAAKWLDGNVHVLVPGLDFDKLPNLRSRLWSLANRFNLRVRTKMFEGLLFVQALDREGNPRPDAKIIQPRDVAAPQAPLPAPWLAPQPQEQSQAPDPGQAEA